jgi:hypothetical protein
MIKTYVVYLELQYFLDNQLVFNCLLVFCIVYWYFVMFININSKNYYIFIKYIWVMICLYKLYMMIL